MKCLTGIKCLPGVVADVQLAWRPTDELANLLDLKKSYIYILLIAFRHDTLHLCGMKNIFHSYESKLDIHNFGSINLGYLYLVNLIKLEE